MRLATPVHRLLYRVLSGAVEMRWSWALAITAIHAAVTFTGFRILGEDALIDGAVQFLYFYVVTGSSVGYGDFSPLTNGGKLFGALWVIPGAIALFAFLLGKAATSITLTLRAIMNGFGDFSQKTGHIVVVGYIPGQTELMLGEAKRLHGTHEVVIVATEDISAETASRADRSFVRATSLSHRADLDRAGLPGAAFIVVMARTDDDTLAAAMAVAAFDPPAHIVAYFRNRGPADIIAAHFPKIETITSVSSQMVARALADPGAGEIMQALASTEHGATLFSTCLDAPCAVRVDTLRTALARAGATLIGYRPPTQETPVMTLPEDTEIHPGWVVYYIAAARLGDRFQVA